jgi:predicted metal-dependent phosphotriesterase family hydrolase
MIIVFLEAGYAEHLLLSSDSTGQSTIGYDRTVTKFPPMLRAAGVKEEMLRMVLYDNPRRFLALVPKNA